MKTSLSYPLLRQAEVEVQVGRQSKMKTMLFFDSLGEAILGIDWLLENRCCWDFSVGHNAVNGIWIQLYRKDPKSLIRRIYVQADTTIQAQRQGNLPAQIIWPTLQTRAAALVAEPRIWRDKVIGVRTIVPADAFFSAVRVANLSEQGYIFHTGELLATAKEALLKQSCNSQECSDSMQEYSDSTQEYSDNTQ